MSVASLARIAGLTPVPAKASRATRRSRLDDRGQHDVDDVLADHRLDRLEEFGAGAKALRRSVAFARRADAMQSRPHLRVLGVGDDEIRAPIGAGANARKFLVQSKHRLLPTPPAGGRPYIYIAAGERSNARLVAGAPIDLRLCPWEALPLGSRPCWLGGAEMSNARRLRILVAGASGALGRASSAAASRAGRPAKLTRRREA